LENIKKEMLEVFFENEERKGGGKVKFIEIDNKSNSALILFEEKTGNCFGTYLVFENFSVSGSFNI
jgi:hypothetical protein